MNSVEIDRFHLTPASIHAFVAARDQSGFFAVYHMLAVAAAESMANPNNRLIHTLHAGTPDGFWNPEGGDYPAMSFGWPEQ